VHRVSFSRALVDAFAGEGLNRSRRRVGVAENRSVAELHFERGAAVACILEPV